MSTILIDDIELYYEKYGNKGKKVLMLHGWGSNIDLFAPVIGFAKKKYHVVAMDMPGFGKSDEPKEPMNVDDYVNFVLDFVKTLFPEEKEM